MLGGGDDGTKRGMMDTMIAELTCERLRNTTFHNSRLIMNKIENVMAYQAYGCPSPIFETAFINNANRRPTAQYRQYCTVLCSLFDSR